MAFVAIALIASLIIDCRDSYVLVRRENDGVSIKLVVHNLRVIDDVGFCQSTRCYVARWQLQDGRAFVQTTAASQPSLGQFEQTLDDVRQADCASVPIS